MSFQLRPPHKHADVYKGSKCDSFDANASASLEKVPLKSTVIARSSIDYQTIIRHKRSRAKSEHEETGVKRSGGRSGASLLLQTLAVLLELTARVCERDGS